MIGSMYWGYGWGLFAGLASFGFIVLVIVLVVWLIGGARRTEPTATFKALQILEERYARGEISRDEFLERRAILSGRK